MKCFRLSLLTCLVLSATGSQYANAAAFQFYELGAPIIGTAAVGQASVAQDASISYYNPAAMPSLQSSQFLLGAQPVLTYTNFTPNSSNTISGNNGSNAGGFLAGVDGYYVYQYSPKLNFGVSLTMPYGGSLAYDNHWVGRYNVQQMLLYTLNLNPSVGYQVNDWFSFGGGIAIEYANLYQTVAIPISPTTDGQATVKFDNVSPGFNLGVLLTPYSTTRIGVAYRSQIVHQLRGNASFLNTSIVPSANSKLVMPANIIASLSQKINDQWTMLGELGWSNWSTMRNTTVTVSGFSAVTPANWNNTYRVGLGTQYQLSHATLWQVGISYDSSPTTTSKRSPALPMDGQTRVGTGVIYRLAQAVNLGVSYEYMHLGKAAISNTSASGVLSGSYSRNYANVVQASLNVDC